MSYAFDDEDVQTWTPDQPFPQKVSAAILSGVQIRAHNAAFERLIFWYVICPDFGVPEPALERFYCTAAQARAACVAMLQAWPGMSTGPNIYGRQDAVMHLPLTTETQNG